MPTREMFEALSRGQDALQNMQQAAMDRVNAGEALSPHDLWAFGSHNQLPPMLLEHLAAAERSPNTEVAPPQSSQVRTAMFALNVHPLLPISVHVGAPLTLLFRGNGERGEAHPDSVVDELEIGDGRARGWAGTAALAIATITERFTTSVGGCVTVFVVDNEGVGFLSNEGVGRLAANGLEEALASAVIDQGQIMRLDPDGGLTGLRDVLANEEGATQEHSSSFVTSDTAFF